MDESWNTSENTLHFRMFKFARQLITHGSKMNFLKILFHFVTQIFDKSELKFQWPDPTAYLKKKYNWLIDSLYLESFNLLRKFHDSPWNKFYSIKTMEAIIENQESILNMSWSIYLVKIRSTHLSNITFYTVIKQLSYNSY